MTQEKTKQIGIRIGKEDVRLLRRICKRRGEDLSDFVRRAIRTEMAKLDYLTAADKKALGLRSKKINPTRYAG
jgi:hypothetical protein